MNYLHHPNCQGHQENKFGCPVPEEANPGSQPDSLRENKCCALCICRMEDTKDRICHDEGCECHKPEVSQEKKCYVCHSCHEGRPCHQPQVSWIENWVEKNTGCEIYVTDNLRDQKEDARTT